MTCPTCHGRKPVWRLWDPGQGIRVRYEDVCETCYGSGIDLGDACGWASVPDSAPCVQETR